MKINAGFTLLFILFSITLDAQSKESFRIERLGTEDGLSHRWAMSVEQDSKGYIWVGTYDGLNRFDGHDFITYRPSASGRFPVSADLIRTIEETEDGLFYLSTQYGTLTFNPATGTFDSLPISHKLDRVIILLPGQRKDFLTSNFYFQGEKNEVINFYEVQSSGELIHLATSNPFPLKTRWMFPVQCNKTSAWFWDFDGHYSRLDLATNSWADFPVEGSKLCPVDRQNKLWIPGHEELQPFQLPDHVRDVNWLTFTIEPGRGIWLYSTHESELSSLYQFNLSTKQLELAFPEFHESEFFGHRYLASSQPFHFTDMEGTVWLAGFNGLYHVRGRKNLFQHYLSTETSTIDVMQAMYSIRHLVETETGDIYFLMNGIVFKISHATDDVVELKVTQKTAGNQHIDMHPELENYGLVHSILKGNDGLLYMGTLTGIISYDPKNKIFQFFPVPHGSPYLFADFGDRILYFSYDKNYFFQKSTGTSSPSPGFHCTEYQEPCYIPEEKIIWEYNDTGIVKIDLVNMDFIPVRLYEEPREQRCMAIHRGYIWLGTSRGLEKVDPKTFTHTNFDHSKGIPGNFIYNMVADGDYLYLGTSHGLCQFNVTTSEVKNFYVEDGLSHNEFNTTAALKASNGKIYMGGLNGVNAFFPKDLEQKKNIATDLLLSRYSLYDSKQDSLFFHTVSKPVESIILSPSTTSLNLYLALTSYIDPHNNQYSWRMEGLDEDWYHAGNQHVAMYRHIPPGHYTFRARASDPFGNWSETEISIPVIVLRPWYSRWWAWLLYSLVMAAVLLAFYQNQLRKRMEHAENKRLQELDTFKNRFFTNITHEFRTPLTVILGMTEKLQHEKLESATKPQHHALLLVRRNAESLLRLINQILDLAKLESHTLKMNYVQGDVLPYLRYITESLQSFANAQNILLRVESTEGEIVMDYDPERLQQIVHNLISNAIKFTPSGGRVTLKADLISPPGDKLQPQLKLTVTDSGTGIPAEEINHIFDRFYQADNLKKAKAGGTGIGLSLTKELVKAMKGEISVESEVSKGTTMTVILPVTRIAPDIHQVGMMNANAYAASSSTLHELPSLSNQGKDATMPQLLLIEDNPDVVEYLIACLDQHYRLEYAYNGRAGIEKAVENSPDLVVSDVMMPEKDGLEVTNELKHDPRTSHIPIVLLTAKADVESKIAGLRKGADAYLAKPFHKEELLATLDNLLENRRKLQMKYLESIDNGQGAEGKEQGAIDNRKLAIENGQQFAPSVTKTELQENEFLNRLKAIIEEHLSDANLDVEMLCKEVGMGRTNLHNKITALTGLSTTLFVRRLRLQKAKELLTSTKMNISEVAYQVGFNDPKFFSRVFSEEYGFPPSSLKR